MPARPQGLAQVPAAAHRRDSGRGNLGHHLLSDHTVPGRFDTTGQLQYARRTTVLERAARQALACELQPGSPDHSWTG